MMWKRGWWQDRGSREARIWEDIVCLKNKAEQQKANKDKISKVRADRNTMIRGVAEDIQKAWDRGDMMAAWKQLKRIQGRRPVDRPV
eukprot:1760546-Prorocentrum_lima.AAC.1